MTGWNNILCWTFALLSGICTANPGELAKADSLYSAGRFSLAALEYERVYFFSSDAGIRDRALLGRSYSQKAEGKFVDAQFTLSRIDTENKPDTFAFMVHYEAALCGLLTGSFVQSDQQLKLLKQRVKDSLLASEACYLEVILLTEQEKWKEAHGAYLKWCRLRGISPDTTAVIDDASDLKLKKRNKARNLSLLLPGLGQAYAGKPWRGLTSLIFTGAAAAYAVSSALSHLWLTTIFTGTGLTLRFYAGGARYAILSCHEWNEEKIRAYKDKIRILVLNTERSMKKE